MRLIFGTLFLALAAAQPALAEDTTPHVLTVSTDTAWRHAETEMALPARAGGLTRESITSYGDGEMNVVAAYRNADDGLIATVYLYRSMTADVPMWFDRALTMIALRSEYGLQGQPTATAFARPGASLASGLRAAADANGAEIRSTAVAIAPLGTKWLLKIRFSAARLDRAALDERLSTFIQGLTWPAESGVARAAVPVEPCARPLNLRNARVVRTDEGNAIMDALSGAITEDAEGPPPVYCREPGATLERGVYRPNGSNDFYLIAIADAGIAYSVGEAMDLSALLGGGGSGGRRFSMTLLERNSTSVYPSFNRLPPVEQALSVAAGAGPTISVSTRDPEPK